MILLSQTKHSFKHHPEVLSSLMAPLSKKGSNKPVLPTSPTSQAPFRNGKRCQANLPDNNDEISYVRQNITDQQSSLRNHLVPIDRTPSDFLNSGYLNDAALAIEEYAAEDTTQIIEACRLDQLKNRHHLSVEQPEWHPGNVETSASAFALLGHSRKHHSDTSEKRGHRFVLADEDREFVRDFLRKVTPRGESPPDMQSITDLMESGNDEEDAKQFLAELEVNMRQRHPPRSQSLIRKRQNPFIRDISRLTGPIHTYRPDAYRLEDL